VRELENAMERAVLLAGPRAIEPEDLPERVRASAAAQAAETGAELSVKRHSRDLERRLIATALRRTHGNKSRAARLLDLSLRALLYKIKDYKLDSPGEEEDPLDQGSG
jgi:two-component system response regulator AtoC